jgi:hypothetical protein
MLKTNDHTMATIIKSVLRDVGGGLFLATPKGQSNIEDVVAIHMYLPPLEIVIEIMIYSQRNIALFHFEKESGASDRVLIPPS